MNKLQVAGRIPESLVNGDGLRYVLFLSGCKHNCPSCHNKELQDFNYGEEMTIQDILDDIKHYSLFLDGVTISGGDPFEQSESLDILLKALKPKYNIWVYTGYTYEEILEDKNKKKLLENIDFLVDGKFVEALKDNPPRFRGSSNQRIINIKTGEVL